ncbi:serine protease [Knoellia sinensis KCTC 19936]|uniref:Serine protease n=1 Tax=Knoellia sinensis KCTC 19936 TaxID=1385520 RepID=A0A0A0J6X2_9MICO|nr:S8 family serine peptidase [Knoellia sinensis]KGN32933.1 serine protease [Knoellia sinensis KCTC 19936]
MNSTFMKKAAVIAATATCAVATTAMAMPAGAAPLDAPTSFVVAQGGTGSDKAVAAIEAAGGTVVQEWPQIGVVIATASDDTFDDQVRASKGIVAAGPSRAMQAYVPSEGIVPDGTVQGLGPGTSGGDDNLEPRFADQWHMRQIGADKAHLVTDGNRDITVGVLDSGIEADHPDLAANVDASQSVDCTDRGVPNTDPKAWQPTTSSHGTHVAGTIAAARNGEGVIGVAPNVKLASVKVVEDAGYIYPEYAICGFIWAAEKGMEVTNNSYYIDPYGLWCKSELDEKAAILAVERALKYSEKKDVVNVAAAGNSAWDLSKPIHDEGSPNNVPEPTPRDTDQHCYDMPTEVGNTVTVSSVGPTAAKSFYSNWGRGVVDVAAPGGDSRVVADTPSKNGRVLSTVLHGGYGFSQGTSMASPHAAGVVALIRGTDMGLNAKQAVKTLQREANAQPCPEFYDANRDGVNDATCEGKASGSGYYGAGLIDALAAVTK